MQKVLVGISGGVDSYVAAMLLKQRGYEVVGVTFDFWETVDTSAIENSCREYGITLIRRQEKELFRELVVEPFVSAYLNARTPNPCSICNSYVKWILLYKVATELGINHIATGHYVKIVNNAGKYYIYKGVDKNKDQSYFLWGLTQEILARSITPLGDFTKTEVKALAKRFGCENVLKKRESMSICFLQGGDYRDFILSYSNIKMRKGTIQNRQGEILGEHNGLLNYTIGQRRGMPIDNGEHLYVAEMDVHTNTIIVDSKENLFTTEFYVENLNIVREEDLQSDNINIKVRGFGLNPQGEIKVERISENKICIYTADPAWAMAVGQPVAIYKDKLLIGGGEYVE